MPCLGIVPSLYFYIPFFFLNLICDLWAGSCVALALALQTYCGYGLAELISIWNQKYVLFYNTLHRRSRATAVASPCCSLIPPSDRPSPVFPLLLLLFSPCSLIASCWPPRRTPLRSSWGGLAWPSSWGSRAWWLEVQPALLHHCLSTGGPSRPTLLNPHREVATHIYSTALKLMTEICKSPCIVKIILKLLRKTHPSVHQFIFHPLIFSTFFFCSHRQKIPFSMGEGRVTTCEVYRAASLTPWLH